MRNGAPSAEENRSCGQPLHSVYRSGMAREGLGDHPAAAEHFRKAIDHTEELRAGLSPAEKAEFYNVRVEAAFTGPLRTRDLHESWSDSTSRWMH